MMAQRRRGIEEVLFGSAREDMVLAEKVIRLLR